MTTPVARVQVDRRPAIVQGGPVRLDPAVRPPAGVLGRESPAGDRAARAVARPKAARVAVGPTVVAVVVRMVVVVVRMVVVVVRMVVAVVRMVGQVVGQMVGTTASRGLGGRNLATRPSDAPPRCVPSAARGEHRSHPKASRPRSRHVRPSNGSTRVRFVRRPRQRRNGRAALDRADRPLRSIRRLWPRSTEPWILVVLRD